MRSTYFLHQLRGSFAALTHVRGLLVVPALLLMSATSINCTEDPPSNGSTATASSSSSGSSSGNGGDGASGGNGGSGGAGAGGMGGTGGMAPQFVVGTFRVFDGQTSMAIPGAPVALGAEMQQTNAIGEAMFNIAFDSPFEVIASPMQYLPLHFFGIAGNADFRMSRGFLTEMTISQVAVALGETYEPTKAIIAVNGAGPDLKSLPESFQVDTNAKYSFALVPDKSSPVGYSKGNASLAGDVTQVFLMNVDPGPVPLTVTLQTGKSCNVYPSSMPQGAEKIMAYAHEVSTLSFVCQ